MLSLKVQQIENAPKKESNKDDTQKIMKSQGFLSKFEGLTSFYWN